MLNRWFQVWRMFRQISRCCAASIYAGLRKKKSAFVPGAKFFLPRLRLLCETCSVLSGKYKCKRQLVASCRKPKDDSERHAVEALRMNPCVRNPSKTKNICYVVKQQPQQNMTRRVRRRWVPRLHLVVGFTTTGGKNSPRTPRSRGGTLVDWPSWAGLDRS